MRINSFYQFCVYICIALIVVTLSINFVSGLNVFEIPYDAGYQTGDDTSGNFVNLTNITSDGESGGMDLLWAGVLSSAAFGGMVVAWITRSTTIIGVYVFSAVFWVSYLRCLSVVYISYLEPLFGFIMIFTVAMVFLWAGAIAGMLSGSG